MIKVAKRFLKSVYIIGEVSFYLIDNIFISFNDLLDLGVVETCVIWLFDCDESSLFCYFFHEIFVILGEAAFFIGSTFLLF